MNSILLVDVGNTSATLALAKGQRITNITRVPTSGLTSTTMRVIARRVASHGNVEGSVLSSVVPSITRKWITTLQKLVGDEPIVVGHRIKLNVAISYPHPETIGGDRIANACGAIDRYGAPVIVADFGTALTFDIVSTSGAYIGGIIAPGLPLMTDYLADKTALLPHIKLKGPHGKIGKSTVGAMRIGARVGYRGMVREIVDYLLKQQCMRDAGLCATGGFAEWALEDLGMPFSFDPDLTLYGMSRIYKLNKEV